MIRIDDTLLEEIGLASLPKQERDQLLRQIYETLEMRVGMRLAERMSDQQLDEFERFIDGDVAFTEDYLNTQKPGWAQSEAYQGNVKAAQTASQQANQPFNENAVKAEFGALAWLETNFPDYKQVVAEELEKLKVEVKKDSSKILEAMQGQGVPAQPISAPSAQPQVAAHQPDFSSQPAPAPLSPQPHQTFSAPNPPSAPTNSGYAPSQTPPPAPAAPVVPPPPSFDDSQQPPMAA